MHTHMGSLIVTTKLEKVVEFKNQKELNYFLRVITRYTKLMSKIIGIKKLFILT